MFLQKANSSVSSLANIPQGEEVNFELDSFQELQSDSNSKPSLNTQADIESQLNDWRMDFSGEKRKKWLKWFGICLIWVLATLLIANVRFTKSSITSQKDWTANKRGFTIDDVLDGKFVSFDETFTFVKPAESLTFTRDMDPGLYLTLAQSNEANTVVARQLYDKTFEKKIIATSFEYNGNMYNVESIKVDYELTRAIIGSKVKSVFRHSSTALYWILDIESGEMTPVKTQKNQDDHPRLSYCHFSPSYNFIYFVYDNDLYIQLSQSSEKVYRITQNGSNDIYNGISDWVYEEEILADDVAVWWAPDDSKLIFAQINDYNVNEYKFQTFINNLQTTGTRSIKYPLPGQPNPILTLMYYETSTGIISTLSRGSDDAESLLYYGRWISADEFLFKETDRYSKVLSTKIFNSKNTQLEQLLVQDSKKYNGWIEKCKDIFVIKPLESGDHGFLDILPDSDGFNHIFYFKNSKDINPVQLTKGEWEVSDIIGFNYDSKVIFFHSNKYHPMSQHLFSTVLSSSENVNALQNPNSNGYYIFTMSPGCSFSMKKYLGPDLPYTIVGTESDVLNEEIDHVNIISLTKNDDLKIASKKFDFPSVSYKDVLIDTVSLNYIEIRPKNMDSTRKYPLLVTVYGGPGSQTFNTKFTTLLEESIASSLGAIVLKIEPRGTGGKGWKFKSYASNNIGFWEPRDIIAVTKAYIKSNKNIDEEKIAVWGWSYGGFSTLKTLEHDKGLTFKYGVAVAPVTNWKYYDSVYSERYLGEISATDGYGREALVNNYDAFKETKRFLLMHGTADDNVHIQNTFALVDQLNVHNVRNYDLHIFPDSDHSIRYHNGQRIVYQKIFYWLKDAFLGKLDSLE